MQNTRIKGGSSKGVQRALGGGSFARRAKKEHILRSYAALAWRNRRQRTKL